MKKIIAIILTIIIVSGLCVGIGAATVYNSPKNIALDAITGVFGDLTKREEIAPIWNMLNDGSACFSMSKFESDGYDELEGGHISGKIYFSPDALVAENVNIELSDFSLNGDAYISNEYVYISESEILDDEYKIAYEDLTKEFEQSIFAYGSESEYAIDSKNTYDDIIEILKSLKNYNKLQSDVEKLTEQHVKGIWDIICDNAEFESKNNTVILNGERYSARVISITMSRGDILNLGEDICKYLSTDDTIVDFLDKYAQALMVEYGDDYDSIEELYEEILEEVEEYITEICDEIADEFEENIEIRIITPKTSHELLKLDVKLDGESIFYVDFGEDGLDETQEINIEIDGEKISYVITKNTKDSYKATLDYDGWCLMDLAVNKAKESYTLKIDDEYYTLTGAYIENGDTTTITVDKITETWYSWRYGEVTDIYTTDIKIVIDQDDTIPHNYSNWTTHNTEQHKKTCEYCDDTVYADHTWNEGKVTTAPTTDSEGIKTYTCTDCGETKTETIAKLPTEQEKPNDNTQNSNDNTTQPTDDTPKTADDEAKSSGCGSNIFRGVGIIVTVLGIAFIVIRKKQNN